MDSCTVLSWLYTDTNWQYQIYVSSSDGTNSSSCWNGSASCNTLNLALQGVQHNSTVIYLYPGIYTLDDEVRNISRVAIQSLVSVMMSLVFGITCKKHFKKCEVNLMYIGIHQKLWKLDGIRGSPPQLHKCSVNL